MSSVSSPAAARRRRSSRSRKVNPAVEEAIKATASAAATKSSSKSSQRRSKRPREDPSYLLYGLEIRPAPRRNQCAGCQDEYPPQLHSDTALLCDGCPREYHLDCAGFLPKSDVIASSTSSKQDEKWYCRDCHPTGSATQALQQYLVQQEEDRFEFALEVPVTTAVTSSDVTAAYLQHRATTMVTIQKKPSRLSVKKLLRDFQSKSLSAPHFWIGKPIRLYAAGLYHRGRITQTRPNQGEYWVQFPAGQTLDHKRDYGHWIRLEDHCLYILADAANADWVPSPLQTLQNKAISGTNSSRSSAAGTAKKKTTNAISSSAMTEDLDRQQRHLTCYDQLQLQVELATQEAVLHEWEQGSSSSSSSTMTMTSSLAQVATTTTGSISTRRFTPLIPNIRATGGSLDRAKLLRTWQQREPMILTSTTTSRSNNTKQRQRSVELKVVSVTPFPETTTSRF